MKKERSLGNATVITVRDSMSGRLVTVKGAGALKGKMTISEKVDLTKPIAGLANGNKLGGSISSKASSASTAKR